MKTPLDELIEKNDVERGETSTKGNADSDSALSDGLYCVVSKVTTRFFNNAEEVATFMWGKSSLDHKIYKRIDEYPMEITEMQKALEAI